MTGKVTLAEGANPGSGGSGYSRVYVNAAGQLCYVRSDGIERPVPWSPTVYESTANRATADQSIASQAALVDATNFGFAIAASEEWTALANLDVGALLSTTGVMFGVTMPAGATLNAVASLVPDVAGNTNFCSLRTTANATAMNFPAANEVGVSNAAVTVSIWVLNGANAGTVQLQFAQSANSATALLIRKGSSIVAHRVA